MKIVTRSRGVPSYLVLHVKSDLSTISIRMLLCSSLMTATVSLILWYRECHKYVKKPGKRHKEEEKGIETRRVKITRKTNEAQKEKHKRGKQEDSDAEC